MWAVGLSSNNFFLNKKRKKRKKKLSPHYGNNHSDWTRTLSGPLLLLRSQTAALYLNQSTHKTPRAPNHTEHFQLARSHRWGNSTGTPDKPRDSTSFMGREKSTSARAETRQRTVLCVILAFGSDHVGLKLGRENTTWESTGARAVLFLEDFLLLRHWNSVRNFFFFLILHSFIWQLWVSSLCRFNIQHEVKS